MWRLYWEINQVKDLHFSKIRNSQTPLLVVLTRGTQVWCCHELAIWWRKHHEAMNPPGQLHFAVLWCGVSPGFMPQIRIRARRELCCERVAGVYLLKTELWIVCSLISFNDSLIGLQMANNFVAFPVYCFYSHQQQCVKSPYPGNSLSWMLGPL